MIHILSITNEVNPFLNMCVYYYRKMQLKLLKADYIIPLFIYQTYDIAIMAVRPLKKHYLEEL